ncbi:ATP-binding protein [Gammaproteobacteria bacterium]|nr:ATP-binding protein [Gammaproteobacteria bacterium]
MKISFLNILKSQNYGSVNMNRRLKNFIVFSLVALGPFLAGITYLGMGPLKLNPSSEGLRFLIFLDVFYILVISAVIVRRIIKLKSAIKLSLNGAQLHLKLTIVFSLIALVPTILVAIFSTITLNFGLDGWFSERVRLALSSSQEAAEAYYIEKQDNLLSDVVTFSEYINRTRDAGLLVGDSDLREVLSKIQGNIQRGLKEVFVIDGAGVIRSRGDKSYLFDFEKPSNKILIAAEVGEPLVINDWENNELRVVVKLNLFHDRFLYVSRAVNGNFLQLLDETNETVRFYKQLEKDRGRIIFDFGLLYLGFSLMLILAATWVGFWYAEKLSRPIGELADASKKIGFGDLSIRVIESNKNDEISVLGRTFNKMTSQLELQRDELLETNTQIEKRRILFDSVLSSVSTGVIGTDSFGEITFINKSALLVLNIPKENSLKVSLSLLIPEFAEIFEKAKKLYSIDTSSEIKITRLGKLENLLVRIRCRTNKYQKVDGYVVVFDDVTELVSAQKMAAWGDVARRIAHEIKNPLTPIKLSAERLYRKLNVIVGSEESTLKRYTDVIIRQTEDIQRIVDEFSKFARMPEPEKQKTDLTELLSDVILLQQSSMPNIEIMYNMKGSVPLGIVDKTMVNQVFTNLIKNAGEAILAAERNKVISVTEKTVLGRILITLSFIENCFTISIKDDGIGLPENPINLFEPYVTSRKEGTGLGLSIVKKIIEQHNGTISLNRVSLSEGHSNFGTEVVVLLPHSV